MEFVYKLYIIHLHRLYTGPKDSYVFEVLSSPAYKKVMENNVDLELSFNNWRISREKTLKEPKKAYFDSFPEQYQVLMPAWKSSTFLGRSMIMNKKSQFTKIFSQAILDMKNTGTLDIIIGEKFRRMDQSYNLQHRKEKPLGYKKLAFLFAVLLLGTIISLFVALFECFAKLYHKRQKYATTIHELIIDDRIEEILEDMSIEEIENTFQRILQKHVKTSYMSNKEENICNFAKGTKYMIPNPSAREKTAKDGDNEKF